MIEFPIKLSTIDVQYIYIYTREYTPKFILIYNMTKNDESVTLVKS